MGAYQIFQAHDITQIFLMRMEMNRRLLITFGLTLFLTGAATAQERLVNKADEQYQSYSFSPAIDIYQKVLDKGYTSADLISGPAIQFFTNPLGSAPKPGTDLPDNRQAVVTWAAPPRP